jgi:hypothetical protein
MRQIMRTVVALGGKWNKLSRKALEGGKGFGLMHSRHRNRWYGGPQ